MSKFLSTTSSEVDNRDAACTLFVVEKVFGHQILTYTTNARSGLNTQSGDTTSLKQIVLLSIKSADV